MGGLPGGGTRLLANFPLMLWALALAYEDWRWRRLPNLLLLAGLVWAGAHCLLHGVSPLGAPPLQALAAGATALVLLLPLHLAGWMGAGDVKLMAVVGCLGGFSVLLSVFLLASILAGGLALLVLLPLSRPYLAGAGLDERRKGRVPFAVAVAGGLLAVLSGCIDSILPGAALTRWLHG